MSYIQLKRRNWHCRIVIPKDVRAAFKGRAEFTKSLGTTSEREAQRLAAPYVAEWLRQISDARKSLQSVILMQFDDRAVHQTQDGFEVRTLDGSVILKRSARQGLDREVAKKWFETEWAAHFSQVWTDGVDNGKNRERLDPNKVRNGIVSHFEQFRPALSSRPSFIRECISVLNQYVKFDDNRIEMDSIFPDESVMIISNAKKYDLLNQIFISDAIEQYFSGPAKVKQKTETLFRARTRSFMDFLSRDKPIQSISRSDVENFRSHLLASPSGRNPDAQLSKSTVNSYVNSIRAVLGPACSSLSIDNPFSGLRALKSDQFGDSDYRSFTNEEIRKIFGDGFGLIRSKPSTRPSDFWVPLALLLHGSRLNEWAQAKRSQFVKDDDIWTFQISGYLKTKSSLRTIPLHSSMIELGFLDFLDRVSSERIFPECLETDTGQFSAALSKRLNRAIDAAGIGGGQKVVHSYRHTWLTKAREALVPTDWQNVIVGHKNSGEGPDYGSYPMKNKQKFLESTDFPLDLKRLKSVADKFLSQA